MKIQFTDFGVDDSSTLGMTAIDESKESNLTFQLPERFVPANDLIGLAISTMVGTKYDQIYIDLPLTARTQATIESLTEASVNSPLLAMPQSAQAGKNLVLNFSGGFDSLATVALLPDDTKLVSLDFGGNFQREAEFFKTFDTTSVATNFRSQEFADRDMASAAGKGVLPEELQPRSEETIADDYATALEEFLKA